MTGIEWTDTTWNPVVGCSRVSPGCEHCYAAAMDKRIRGKDGEEWRDWSAPNAAYNVRLYPERLEAPLRWRKPRRVFVNSMSDLFHEEVPDEFIDRVFAVMALTPQHTYQVLTKRPERMRAYMGGEDEARADAVGEAMEAVSGRPVSGDPADDSYDRLDWPLPNVWLGVSVEDQRRADERIPLLLQTPAAVRFLSCEPLLITAAPGAANEIAIDLAVHCHNTYPALVAALEGLIKASYLPAASAGHVQCEVCGFYQIDEHAPSCAVGAAEAALALAKGDE